MEILCTSMAVRNSLTSDILPNEISDTAYKRIGQTIDEADHGVFL